MDLSEIVTATGLPGLYKVAGRRSDGMIITSLSDGKSQFASVRLNPVAPLDSIIIYTTGENVPLKEVLASIKKNESTHPMPDAKDEDGLKKWMAVILPAYDKERVHLSDMKKLAKWYKLLNDKNLIEELTAEKSEEGGENLTTEQKEAISKKESKQKVTQQQASVKAHTKPAAGAKKITTPRKAS